MKTILLIGLICLTLPLFAEDEIHVHPMNSGSSVSAFQKKGYKVHPTNSLHSANLPFTKQQKETWIKSSGLLDETKSWSELDKDILVIRSKSLPEEKFIQNYSKLKAASLKSLRSLTQSEGKW